MSLEYRQYREEWEKLPEASIVSDFPLHLDIELTNRCNLRCNMCPHHGSDKINEREPQDMDFDLYEKIIDEGSQKGLKSIKLNYGGEPFLYDNLIKAIQYAKFKGILDIRINTNGFLLTPEIDLADLDILIISDYDICETKIKKYISLKKLGKWKKPFIQIKTEHPERWKDYADEIISNNYFEYNLKEDFTPSNFKCTQPWQRFLILADGTACSCSCGIFIENKILGNAWHFSLEELWNGKKMKFLRYCHEFGETHLLKQCRMCPARKEYINKKKEEK